MIELPTCPSTNSWALDHREALAHGSCVWTRRQTAGRGRDGTAWRSPPGVLTASFVLDLDARVDVTQLALAAGLAIAHAVEDLVPAAKVAIKWPNDCMLAGRKLAGVLCERPGVPSRTRVGKGDGRDAVVVGIGLNVDPHWGEDHAALPLAAGKTPPIALAEVGAPPSELAVLIAVRSYLLQACGVLGAGGWDLLLPVLRERDWLRDRSVEVVSGDRRWGGTAVGLDAAGGLRVRGEAGERTFASGSVLVGGDTRA
ncbi:MAG: biotin--[acetyl-CoA-carboxylase] ligase [Planctomycetes bacterium]|nr:biotin--[acetyl-CoA-carboxylase] ligase [Planctomycetota bacterium]